MVIESRGVKKLFIDLDTLLELTRQNGSVEVNRVLRKGKDIGVAIHVVDIRDASWEKVDEDVVASKGEVTWKKPLHFANELTHTSYMGDQNKIRLFQYWSSQTLNIIKSRGIETEGLNIDTYYNHTPESDSYYPDARRKAVSTAMFHSLSEEERNTSQDDKNRPAIFSNNKHTRDSSVNISVVPRGGNLKDLYNLMVDIEKEKNVSSVFQPKILEKFELEPPPPKLSDAKVVVIVDTALGVNTSAIKSPLREDAVETFQRLRDSGVSVIIINTSKMPNPEYDDNVLHSPKWDAALELTDRFTSDSEDWKRVKRNWRTLPAKAVHLAKDWKDACNTDEKRGQAMKRILSEVMQGAHSQKPETGKQVDPSKILLISSHDTFIPRDFLGKNSIREVTATNGFKDACKEILEKQKETKSKMRFF